MRLRNAIFLIVLLCCSSCTKIRAKWTASEYCDCDKSDDLMKVLNCKKDILYEHRNDLKDKAYEKAFWENVRDD